MLSLHGGHAAGPCNLGSGSDQSPCSLLCFLPPTPPPDTHTSLEPQLLLGASYSCALSGVP